MHWIRVKRPPSTKMLYGTQLCNVLLVKCLLAITFLRLFLLFFFLSRCTRRLLCRHASTSCKSRALIDIKQLPNARCCHTCLALRVLPGRLFGFPIFYIYRYIYISFPHSFVLPSPFFLLLFISENPKWYIA